MGFIKILEMHKILIALLVSLGLFSIQCSTNSNSEAMNGTWVLKGYERHQLVEIKNDTITLLSCENNSKLSTFFELTSDSLNIPNPCLKQREIYKLVGDTIFVGSSLLLFRTKTITSKIILSDNALIIDLGNYKPFQKGGRLYPIRHNLYLGKSTKESKGKINEYFQNGFCLKIDHVICDTTDFKGWIHSFKSYNLENTFIALYKDKDFPSKDFDKFKKTLFSKLEPNTKVFRAYFDKESNYYLSYTRIK